MPDSPALLPPVDWLAANVHFGPARPHPGAFSVARSPYLREPLETAIAAPNREYWMIASWQSAKTLWLELVALWAIKNHPRPMLWHAPTMPKAESFAKTRFNQLLEDCPAVMDLLTADQYANANLLKRFVQCFLQIQGAHDLGSLQSSSAAYIFNDEPWLYPPGHLKEIRARKTRFKIWRILNATTAGTERDEVDQAWQDSDQREWHFVCPACKGAFIPRWDHVDLGGDAAKDPAGAWIIPEARKRVALKCPLCATVFPWSDKTLESLNAGGHYRATRGEAAGEIVAWHYNALVHHPWPELAEEFIRAQRELRFGSVEGLKTFVQRRLAETWVESSHIHQQSELVAGGYQMAPWIAGHRFAEGKFTPWLDAELTTLTIDVQKDCFYLVARGWAKRESRLLYTARLVSADDIDLLRSDLLIPENHTAADVGWSPVPALVHQLCHRFGWLALNGIKQRSFYHKEDGVHRIYSPVHWVNPWLGTVHDTGRLVAEFRYSSNAAKDRLELLRSIREPAPFWTIAEDAPEWYRKHQEAEKKVQRLTRVGQPFFEWTRIGSRPNHAFDCEVMATVLASMFGLVGAEAAAGESEAPSERPADQ